MRNVWLTAGVWGVFLFVGCLTGPVVADSIVGWGDNGDGQAAPPAGTNFAVIAAGEYHSLALRSDGSVVGWGRNDKGQATPPSANDLTAIAAGAIRRSAPLLTPWREGTRIKKSDSKVRKRTYP